MKDALNELRCKAYQVREKIAALVCLTVIAIVALAKMDDPENLLVNIVVAIAAFITGSSTRRTDMNDKPK